MDISENRKKKNSSKGNRLNKLINLIKDFVFFHGEDIPKYLFCIGITVILFIGGKYFGKHLIRADRYVNTNYTYQVGSIVERNNNLVFSIYDYLDSISSEDHILELLVKSDSSIYKIDNIDPDIVLFKDNKSSANLILKSKRLSRYNYSTYNKLSSINYILSSKLNDQDTLIISIDLDCIGKYIKIKRVD